jgi:hypothetical protein
MKSLPETGFLRLSQIIGQKPITIAEAARNRQTGRRGRVPRCGHPPLIPISATTWWKGIASGAYPQPLKLGGTTLWRAEDIHELVERIGGRER